MNLRHRGVLVLVCLLGPASAVAKPPVASLPDTGVFDPSPVPTPGPAVDPIGAMPDVLDPGDNPVAECTRPDNCLQTDADGDGIPDMWEDKLAAKFAPEVHLAPQAQDWTRPASVEWYLARVHMRFEHDDCGDCQVLAVGAVTQDNMWQQSHRGKNWRCAHRGGASSSANASNFFLQPPDDDVHAGAPASQWRTYVHVRRTDGGYDLQYWFFFPYNDSVGSFNHEGDWEHITVRTDGAGEFASAWFAQHEGGRRYLPAALTFVGDTHPQVWIADGSHASYPRVGSFDIPGVPAFDDHTYRGGPIWQTWTNWVNVGEKDQPRAGQHFIRYGGRWGEHGTTSVTTGPRGPSFQDAWNSF